MSAVSFLSRSRVRKTAVGVVIALVLFGLDDLLHTPAH